MRFKQKMFPKILKLSENAIQYLTNERCGSLHIFFTFTLYSFEANDNMPLINENVL